VIWTKERRGRRFHDFGINWQLIYKRGGKLTLAIIALHIAAALKHHFFDRIATLKRILS